MFFQIHKPPADSTPPFDPLDWAHTNCLSLLTAPCLCYTAATVAVIFPSSVI